MTDKELDDLEARLREACRDFDGTEMDASWDVQAEDLLTYGELRQAADAIAELRKKNAGLQNALVIALGQINLDYGTGPDPKRADEARDIIGAAIEENTQRPMNAPPGPQQ